MSYRSLRDFISRLEAEQELVRVREPVSTVLEMTEIQTRLRGGRARGAVRKAHQRGRQGLCDAGAGQSVRHGQTRRHGRDHGRRGAARRQDRCAKWEICWRSCANLSPRVVSARQWNCCRWRDACCRCGPRQWDRPRARRLSGAAMRLISRDCPFRPAGRANQRR